MKVLIVGGGGREHTLAWKIGQSKQVDQVFVAPGNAGTAIDAQNVDISDSDIAGLVDFVRKNDVELTVVGPEVPLCLGIVDAFRAENMRVFGPSKEAAQLEGSKIFCKQVLRNAQVPTADWHEFDSASAGMEYVNNRFLPMRMIRGNQLPLRSLSKRTAWRPEKERLSVPLAKKCWRRLTALPVAASLEAQATNTSSRKN